eukprot:TRINITY_DN16305_c0_g1_i2.p1 TRINITY_DN16305_c0_g1~~TRINITY_DN16305_c0_g1_i2.p1  ORF type:complete len:149 (+),score=21.89 TRINITY_DN16305_c0_g1_i2:186-632(+)
MKLNFSTGKAIINVFKTQLRILKRGETKVAKKEDLERETKIVENYKKKTDSLPTRKRKRLDMKEDELKPELNQRVTNVTSEPMNPFLLTLFDMKENEKRLNEISLEKSSLLQQISLCIFTIPQYTLPSPIFTLQAENTANAIGIVKTE